MNRLLKNREIWLALVILLVVVLATTRFRASPSRPIC